MVDLQADNKIVSKTARADLKSSDGTINGTATFTEYDVDGWKYVRVIIDIKGEPDVLAAGKHAVHIHAKADCSCEDFKCAGGHFDPGPYGNEDPDANHGYHAGDLPNITVDGKGNGHMEAITSRVTLSDGPVSILGRESAPDGTSLMIHGKTDPYTPGETGSGISGGPRLACGVIEAT
jgi:superoxide dismutase, Cu-Zn family